MTTPGERPLCEAILYRVFKELEADVEATVFLKAGELAPVILTNGENDFLERGTPMDVWNWLSSLTNSRRRKILIRVWRKLQERGIPAADFDTIKAFVKSELLPWFAALREGPDSRRCKYVARLIQAPHDETHVIAGPYLKPLVGRLKKVWNERHWVFYASVEPEKLDQWLNLNHSANSWFWSDYKAFDATYSEAAWDMIEGFYHMIYPDAPALFWRVLAIWRSPQGVIHSRRTLNSIRYKSDVCNASGRDDTALANALLNGIVLALSFAGALCGRKIEDLTVDDLTHASNLVKIAVVGDDSLVACYFDVSSVKDRIETNIRRFGLQVEAFCSSELVDVTFLGMMPYPVAGRYYWGPTMGRRMYKAYWQRDPVGNLPAWVKGVALQLAHYQCVPVMADLNDRVLELLDGHKATVIGVDPDRIWAARGGKTPRWDSTTLDWVLRRYCRAGLNRYQVQEDLRTIRSINRLPAIVHLWTLMAAVTLDDM